MERTDFLAVAVFVFELCLELEFIVRDLAVSADLALVPCEDLLLLEDRVLLADVSDAFDTVFLDDAAFAFLVFPVALGVSVVLRAVLPLESVALPLALDRVADSFSFALPELLAEPRLPALLRVTLVVLAALLAELERAVFFLVVFLTVVVAISYSERSRV